MPISHPFYVNRAFHAARAEIPHLEWKLHNNLQKNSALPVVPINCNSAAGSSEWYGDIGQQTTWKNLDWLQQDLSRLSTYQHGMLCLQFEAAHAIPHENNLEIIMRLFKNRFLKAKGSRPQYL